MSAAFKLKNGSLMLSTEAPGGIYNSSQLKAIAALCEEDSAIVKVTEDQRLALFVEEGRATEIAARLKKMGLGLRHYRNGLHQPTSCIGALCSEHKQDAQGSAMAVTEALSSIELPNPLRIGINGCSACCLPCHTLDISVMGDDSGYRIYIGGKNSQIAEMAQFVAEGVPAKELPKLLQRIVTLYKKNANGDETLQDLIERTGPSQFISALAPYSQDAAVGDDPFAGDSSQANEEPETESLEDGLQLDDLENDISDIEIEDQDMALVNEEDVEDFDNLSANNESGNGFGDDLDISPADFSEADQDLSTEVPIAFESNEQDFLDEDFSGSDSSLERQPSLEDDVLIADDGENVDLFASDSLEELTDESAESESPLTVSEISLENAELEIEDDHFTTDDLESLEIQEPLADEDIVLDESEELATDLELAGDETEEEISAAIEFNQPAGLSHKAIDNKSASAAEIGVGAGSFDDDEIGDLAADSISEEDESAFEKKFDEDIADAVTYTAKTVANSGDRNEAIRLVESGDNQSTVEPIEVEDAIDETAMDQDDDLGFDDSLDEIPAPVVESVPRSAPKSATRGNWTLTEIRSEGSSVVLEFDTGAEIHLHPKTVQTIGERIIAVGGQKLALKNDGSTISIEADGIRFILPRQVA